MTTRRLVASVAAWTVVLAVAPTAWGATGVCTADEPHPHVSVAFTAAPVADDSGARAWHELFAPPTPQANAAAGPAAALPVDGATVTQDTPAPRPRAVQLSRGYEVRLKVHRLASWATLPLFVTEYALGQKLYDGTGSEGVKSAHGALATGVAALFGVNTVTGVWNLREGRNKPRGRTRRIIHSVLMIGADAGFVATGMLAPDDDDDDDGRGGYGDDRRRHRTVALTSMGVATASYLFMLFTR